LLFVEDPFMGLTKITAKVSSTIKPNKSIVVDFLVDSGAVYSVVPRKVLKKLDIKPERTQRFFLADGEAIERQVGIAMFEYEGHRAAAHVIFGEENDSALMGATTLEGFGFVLDPFSRELRPMLMRM
jgi:clan AA aspartic protease